DYEDGCNRGGSSVPTPMLFRFAQEGHSEIEGIAVALRPGRVGPFGVAPLASDGEIELHHEGAAADLPLLGAALDGPVGLRRLILFPHPAPQPYPLPDQAFVADVDHGLVGCPRIGFRGKEKIAAGRAERLDDWDQIADWHLRDRRRLG